MEWLAVSIVASIVLTVVLNLVLRAVPGAGERLHDRLTRLAEPPERSEPSAAGSQGTRTRVIVPWRTMLLVSLVLTVAINVLFLLLR